MKGTMQGVTLVADWDPKPGFKLGAKDIEGRQTYLGSLVWRYPKIEILLLALITIENGFRRSAKCG